MKKVLLFLFSIYGFVIFIALMLIVFPLVCIISLISGQKGGRYLYMICTAWADIAMLFWMMPHRNINELPKLRSPVIFIFNHISYMDIPVLLKALRKQDIRILAKAALASVPIFGFIYRKVVILVDRSNAAARAQSIENMKMALSKNLSIAIAPEGTFNTTSNPLKFFYDGAFRLALDMQIVIQPVIFPDTQKLLHSKSIFTLSPGCSRAIFLEPISPHAYMPDDVEGMKADAHSVMSAGLIKYNASWIK